MQCAQHEYLRHLLDYPKLICDLLTERLHFPTDFIIGNLGVYLVVVIYLWANNLADCFQRHALRSGNGGGERVPRYLPRRDIYQSTIKKDFIYQGATS